LEGLVCKLRNAPYRSGHSEAWLKVKCVKRDALTIVGFVPDRQSVASLHLAKRRGKSLTYVGKAGTGFSRKVAHELYAILQPKRPEGAPLDRNTVWVKPERNAEIEYRAITGEGLLRHAAYKGLARH
jgi:bifunctional non-homologous end joining protein LigD